jgi:two-component system chemotaxis response regulator CheY
LHNSSFEPINTAKALIADDSAMIRKLIKTSLEEFNIPNCDEAANGAEAWTMLNSSKSYDIFIMDYNMPQLNGLELALNIHNNKEKFANTKIIAISSSFNKETIAQFKNFGVGTFIKKPFRTAILKAAIGPILAYGLNKNTSPSLFGLDMLFKSTFTNATCDYNYVVLNFAEESLMIEINAILTASYIYANS